MGGSRVGDGRRGIRIEAGPGRFVFKRLLIKAGVAEPERRQREARTGGRHG